MVSVSFSPKSRQDLIDIGDFIAKDSRANARRFVAKLMMQCQRIANAPMGYLSREDLAASLRMASMGRYVIFFRVLEGGCMATTAPGFGNIQLISILPSEEPNDIHRYC